MGNIPFAVSSSESEYSDEEIEFSGSTETGTGTDNREKKDLESFFDSLLDGIVRNAVESVEMRKKENEGKTLNYIFFNYRKLKQACQ